MVKCVKCDREAEYESPDDLCELHWQEWWNEGTDSHLLRFIVLSEKLSYLPSTLTLFENYKQTLEEGNLYDDTHVIEKFKACCWCEAVQHYNKLRGVEEYTMWHCHEEFDVGNIPCEFYFEMKARQNEDR